MVLADSAGMTVALLLLQDFGEDRNAQPSGTGCRGCSSHCHGGLQGSADQMYSLVWEGLHFTIDTEKFSVKT